MGDRASRVGVTKVTVDCDVTTRTTSRAGCFLGMLRFDLGRSVAEVLCAESR